MSGSSLRTSSRSNCSSDRSASTRSMAGGCAGLSLTFPAAEIGGSSSSAAYGRGGPPQPAPGMPETGYQGMRPVAPALDRSASHRWVLAAAITGTGIAMMAVPTSQGSAQLFWAAVLLGLPAGLAAQVLPRTSRCPLPSREKQESLCRAPAAGAALAWRPEDIRERGIAAPIRPAASWVKLGAPIECGQHCGRQSDAPRLTTCLAASDGCAAIGCRGLPAGHCRGTACGGVAYCTEHLFVCLECGCFPYCLVCVTGGHGCRRPPRPPPPPPPPGSPSAPPSPAGAEGRDPYKGPERGPATALGAGPPAAHNNAKRGLTTRLVCLILANEAAPAECLCILARLRANNVQMWRG